MIDPVAVDVDGKHGHVVEREYAEVMGLTILDVPVIAHGQLRGVFRLDGRALKPKVPKGAPAIPTTTDTAGKPASGNADGVAVEPIKE